MRRHFAGIALASARGHWLLALGELEEPGRRPCLVMAAGLPGSGKSTLARRLEEAAGFTAIRSDVVRKELAAAAGVGEGGEDIYTPEWNERTYAECLRRAEALLFEGARVLIDANFREERRRLALLDAARRWGVLAAILVCRAPAEAVRGRLLAFFPGEHENGNYRLFDARDGWNYHAIPIKAQEG